MSIWNFFRKPTAEMVKQQNAFDEANLKYQTVLLELQTKELELKKVQLAKMMEEEDRKTRDEYEFV